MLAVSPHNHIPLRRSSHCRCSTSKLATGCLSATRNLLQFPRARGSAKQHAPFMGHRHEHACCATVLSAAGEFVPVTWSDEAEALPSSTVAFERAPEVLESWDYEDYTDTCVEGLACDASTFLSLCPDVASVMQLEGFSLRKLRRLRDNVTRKLAPLIARAFTRSSVATPHAVDTTHSIASAASGPFTRTTHSQPSCHHVQAAVSPSPAAAFGSINPTSGLNAPLSTRHCTAAPTASQPLSTATNSSSSSSLSTYSARAGPSLTSAQTCCSGQSQRGSSSRPGHLASLQAQQVGTGRPSVLAASQLRHRRRRGTRGEGLVGAGRHESADHGSVGVEAMQAQRVGAWA